jgi:hypothetical protein
MEFPVMATRRLLQVKSLLLLGAMAALLALAGCKVNYAEAPKAESAAKPLMTWRVASAYLEDIFAKIPNSSIDDFRRETPDEERALVNASHGETGVKDNTTSCTTSTAAWMIIPRRWARPAKPCSGPIDRYGLDQEPAKPTLPGQHANC